MGGIAAGAMGLGIVISLRDYASKGIDKLKEKVQGLKGVTAEMSRSFSQGAVDVVRGGAMMAGGAMLLATAFNAPVEAAMRFESTMAEVNKVADFSAEEYASMSAGLRELARNIPMTVEELGNIAAAAAQSGVAKADLLDFAEQAAYMGVAFDVAGGQAGQMMADWRAGMGLTLPQVYSLADAVNYLSNNMNATAPALGEVIQRVGAVAMSCGLAEQEVAALGAAFLSAGASPEIAATALKSFTTTLVRGSAMTKSQAEAFRALGFSVEQLAADMQVDARQAIFSVMQTLSQAPEEMRMSMMTQMFGQESLGAIAPLLQNMGNLSQAFELVGAEANYAGSMFAEYEARANTAENAVALLRNRVNDLKIAFGSVALGPFRVVVEAISGVVGMIAGLPKPVFAVIAAFAGLVGTVLILGGAFTAVVGLLKMWNVAVLAAKAQTVLAFTNMKNVVTALGTALTKGPLLGLSKLAIAAALLYLAWRTNFLGMRDAATALAEGFKMAAKAGKDGIVEVDEATYNALNEAGLWDIAVTMGRVFWRARQFVEGFAEGWRDAWRDMLAVWNGFSGAVGQVVGAFRPLLSALGLMDAAGNTNADTWRRLGYVVGNIAPILMTVLAAVKAFAVAKSIFMAIRGAILLMNAAALANPMMAAFALIIAGLTAILMNWESVKATALSVVNAITGSLGSLFDGLVQWGRAIWDALTKPFRGALELWDKLKSIFGSGPSLAPEGPTGGGQPAPQIPLAPDRGSAQSAPMLAAINETKAKQNAAAAAQNPPASVSSSVDVSVEPQVTVVNLDGREVGRAVTKYNAHERKRSGKER